MRNGADGGKCRCRHGHSAAGVSGSHGIGDAAFVLVSASLTTSRSTVGGVITVVDVGPYHIVVSLPRKSLVV